MDIHFYSQFVGFTNSKSFYKVDVYDSVAVCPEEDFIVKLVFNFRKCFTKLIIPGIVADNKY